MINRLCLRRFLALQGGMKTYFLFVFRQLWMKEEEYTLICREVIWLSSWKGADRSIEEEAVKTSCLQKEKKISSDVMLNYVRKRLLFRRRGGDSWRVVGKIERNRTRRILKTFTVLFWEGENIRQIHSYRIGKMENCRDIYNCMFEKKCLSYR